MKCVVCGKEFEPKNPHRKYCSNACGQKAWYYRARAKHPKRVTCPICGKEFETTIHSKQYCSLECSAAGKALAEQRRKGRDKPIKRICRLCGKEFEPTQGNQWYCSLECSNQGWHKRCRGYNKESDETATYERKCEYCGQTFKAHRLQQRFCCTKHTHLAYKETNLRRLEKKPKAKPDKDRFNRLSREARECGMDYGNYVAQLSLGRTYEELRARYAALAHPVNGNVYGL